MQEAIIEGFTSSFSHVTIKTLLNFIDEDVEEIIKEMKPDIIVLGGNLGKLDKWQHPTYGNLGFNLIPFIQNESPESRIISISDNNLNNQNAMKKGAHCSVDKANLSEFFDLFT